MNKSTQNWQTQNTNTTTQDRHPEKQILNLHSSLPKKTLPNKTQTPRY